MTFLQHLQSLDSLKAVTLMVDPCWNGYVQVGMKMKNGKKVPNCVPEGSGKKKVARPTTKKKAGKK